MDLRGSVFKAVAEANGLKMEEVTEDTPIGKTADDLSRLQNLLFKCIGVSFTLTYKSTGELVSEVDELSKIASSGEI